MNENIHLSAEIRHVSFGQAGLVDFSTIRIGTWNYVEAVR